MRIDGIKIESFGRLRDWECEGLASAPVVVILGSNEAGKSTVFSFIETMLYGFEPARGEDFLHAPWQGGFAQGAVDILDDDESPWRIRRILRRRPEAWMEEAGGSRPIANTAANPEWPARQLFTRLFAIDSDELARPTTEVWRGLEARLSSVVDGVIDRDPVEAVAGLRRDANRLWRSDRRGRPEAARLEAQLSVLRERRKEAEADHRALEELGAADSRRRQEQARLKKKGRGIDLELEEVDTHRALRHLRTNLKRGLGELRQKKASAEEAIERSRKAEPSPSNLIVADWGWLIVIVIVASTWFGGQMSGGFAVLAALVGLLGFVALRSQVSAKKSLAESLKEEARRWQQEFQRQRETLREERLSLRDLEKTAPPRPKAARSPERLRAERAAIQDRLKALSKEEGRASAERSALEAKTGVDDLDGEIAAVQQAGRDLRRRRDRMMIAAALIEESRREILETLAPTWIDRASMCFARLTEGRYRGLVTMEEEGRPRLYLQPGDGTAPVPARAPVSRGTAQQAWLAFRLALVDSVDDGADRLPLLLDEVFSEWDRRRIEEAARLLMEVGERRQVFVATARAEIARSFRQQGARVLQMFPQDDGGAGRDADL